MKEKLLPSELSFIFYNQLSEIDLIRLEGFIKLFEIPMMRWSCNHELMLPYSVYESFFDWKEKQSE